MRTRKKTNKKLYLLIALIAVAIGVGVFAYFSVFNKNDDAEPIDQTSFEEKDEGESNDSKKKPLKQPEDNSGAPAPEPEKEVQPSYEGGSANKSDSLTGAINYSAVAGDNLVIRTTINQSISSGSCKLTLRNGGKVVTKTSGIVQNPSSSSCEGFNVPTSELGSGNWSIEIAISGGGKTGTLKGNAKI